MIPEKGKTYHIEFTEKEYPEFTHYVGPALHTGGTDKLLDQVVYAMKMVENGIEYSERFEEKYIIREIADIRDPDNPHDGSTLDSFLLEEASNKIKHLKNLLYECVEYVRAEKALRNTWEGKHARLDKTSDSLIQEIMKQFTPDEEKQAHQQLMKKYS